MSDSPPTLPPPPLEYDSGQPRRRSRADYPTRADSRLDLSVGCLVYAIGFVAVPLAVAAMLPAPGGGWEARTLAVAVGGFMAACVVGGLLSGLVWRRWRFAAGLFIGVGLSVPGVLLIVGLCGR